jgi:hypothetical protein
MELGSYGAGQVGLQAASASENYPVALDPRGPHVSLYFPPRPARKASPNSAHEAIPNQSKVQGTHNLTGDYL